MNKYSRQQQKSNYIFDAAHFHWRFIKFNTHVTLSYGFPDPSLTDMSVSLIYNKEMLIC